MASSIWENALERLSENMGKPTGVTEAMDILIGLSLGLHERLAEEERLSYAYRQRLEMVEPRTTRLEEHVSRLEQELKQHAEHQALAYAVPAD